MPPDPRRPIIRYRPPTIVPGANRPWLIASGPEVDPADRVVSRSSPATPAFYSEPHQPTPEQDHRRRLGHRRWGQIGVRSGDAAGEGRSEVAAAAGAVSAIKPRPGAAAIDVDLAGVERAAIE